MTLQLALGLSLPDDATFENFYVGPNQAVMNFLQHDFGKQERFAYLYGASGAGKTHLLQAYCQQLHQQGLAVAYLPLTKFEMLTPHIFEEMETLALICIDDLQSILQHKKWEEALFHFYNRLQQSTANLLIAASHAPQQLSFLLPDLSSRLKTMLIFSLADLTDNEKMRALELRAKNRGLYLAPEVSKYLVEHCPRDMRSLLTLLEALDLASLSAQKKLTIPFVSKFIQDYKEI